MNRSWPTFLAAAFVRGAFLAIALGRLDTILVAVILVLWAMSEAVCLWVHRVTVNLVVADKQEALHKKSENMIIGIRGFRHRLINHFQAVAGWLQLGNVERARLYMDYVKEELAREADILRLRNKELASELISRIFGLESLGIEITVKVDADKGQEADLPVEHVVSIIDELILLVQEKLMNNRVIRVIIKKDGVSMSAPGLMMEPDDLKETFEHYMKNPELEVYAGANHQQGLALRLVC
ncbi:MAG: Spo0B domain-containing protein [Bacillota bacterium]